MDFCDFTFKKFEVLGLDFLCNDFLCLVWGVFSVVYLVQAFKAARMIFVKLGRGVRLAFDKYMQL